MIGTTLSHYKILDELGRGGMGIVYKAEDTKLDRTVAIKVLPPHALTNEDDRERFYREAKAAAQLHHPHIASIFEIDEAVPESESGEPRPFIAMEFVDGGTLRDEIDKGPMKLKEAVRIASQVGEALKLAHSKEIVHRDIKSHNVMLTRDGDAKVLDFGLAKTAQSTMLTRRGSTLGTVAYMSPEQARGDEVDHRTDIWSLGVMFFEMVAGRLPFAGEYEKAVMYGILNEMAPPLTSLRTGVPMGLEWIVSKCLAKDPNERYQACADLIVDLKTVDLSASGLSRIGSTVSNVSAANVATGATAASQGSGAGTRTVPLVPTAIGAVLLLVVGFLAGRSMMLPNDTTPEPVRRFTIPLDPATGGFNDVISISADGQAVAFEVPDADGAQMYVRFLDEEAARPVVRTNGFNAASLSPDARWLAYKQGRSLFRVSTDGGNPELLSDTLGGDQYSTWRSPTEIVTSGWARRQSSINFYVVEDSRFSAYPTNISLIENDIDHIHYVPDSDLVLYTRWDRSDGIEEASVWARGLNSGREVEVAHRASDGRYFKDGYVLFQRNGDLHAVPFDFRSLEVGNSFLILPARVASEDAGLIIYDIAQDGTLIYLPPEAFGDNQSAVLRIGADIDDLEVIGSRRGSFHDPRFSPDGSKILVQSRDEQVDLWLVDRTLGGTTQRMTDNPGEDETAAWDPDGVHFYYSSDRDGVEYILKSNINNISERDTLYTSEDHIHVESVSRDGRYVFFMARSDEDVEDMWMVGSDSPHDARAILDSPFREYSGMLSPDNNWLVYVSNETGPAEIYLQNFPELNQRRTLTSEGGLSPIWSKDGRSIYYVSGRRLMRIPFEDGQPRASEEIAVIPGRYRQTGIHTEYDVLGNGDEFVFIDTGGQTGVKEMEMQAITGLSELLRQRDPARQ